MVVDSSHAVGVRNKKHSELVNDVVVDKSGQFKSEVDKFVPWLHGYDDNLHVELIDMLQFGVHIPSSKAFDPLAQVPPNQKSTDLYYDEVDTMICTELMAKRIAGPFLLTPPRV